MDPGRMAMPVSVIVGVAMSLMGMSMPMGVGMFVGMGTAAGRFGHTPNIPYGRSGKPARKGPERGFRPRSAVNSGKAARVWPWRRCRAWPRTC